MTYELNNTRDSYDSLGESSLGFEDSYSVRNSSFYKGLDSLEKNLGYDSGLRDLSASIPRLKQLS